MRLKDKAFEVYPPKAKINIYGECHDEYEELRKAYIKGCQDTVAEIMSDTIKRTELPTSLEEAAEKAGLEYAPIIAGESLDLSGQFYETDDVHWPSRCGFINGFRAGAEWMKAKMMEEAVEGYVGVHLTKEGSKVTVNSGYLPKEMGIKNGDKVRIIVIKGD